VTSRSRKPPLIQQNGSSTERFNEQHNDVEMSLSEYSQAPLIITPKDKTIVEANVVPTTIPKKAHIPSPSVVVNPPVLNHAHVLPTNIFQPRLKTIARRERPKVKTTSSRSSRTMMLSKDLKPYDIMEDLDKIQPTITMKQLLVVAPQCRSSLSSSMIRRRPKPTTIHDITLSKDLGAPTVDVIIGGGLIP
jgi:hypothetical protein